MFCTNHSIGRINNINEPLLQDTNENSAHQKCIELLIIEVCQYLDDVSSDVMRTIFKL